MKYCHFNKKDQKKECGSKCRYYNTCIWSVKKIEKKENKGNGENEQSI